jgi:hypothetical protein
MTRISELDVATIESCSDRINDILEKYKPFNFVDLRELTDNPVVKEQILTYIARNT